MSAAKRGRKLKMQTKRRRAHAKLQQFMYIGGNGRVGIYDHKGRLIQELPPAKVLPMPPMLSGVWT